MPFTFSHPALVLPLSGLRRMCLSALVIGSLTPDFEYFFRMRIKSSFSHSMAGLFLFDVPLGIFLLFIYHNIIRDSVIDNMPLFLKSRFYKYKNFDFTEYIEKHWFIVVISVIIGAASHLLWDGFTHRYGYFAQTTPQLLANVSFWGFKMPLYRILQHASTLLGAAIIGVYVYKMPKTADVAKAIRPGYYILLFSIMALIIAFKFYFGLSLKQYGNVVVVSISAALMALTLTPLILRAWDWKRAK